MTSVGQRVAVIVVSLLLAWLTYSFVERPIRFGHLKRWGAPASVTITIVLACFSAFVFSDGGVPTRFSQELRYVLSLMKYDFKSDARVFSCWLTASTPFESYGPECRTGSTLIWGDSHAARLYSGFKQSGIVAAQFTRDGCMPALSAARDVCSLSNASIVEEVARLRPKRVIIFAAWLNHGLKLGDERIESIRRGVKRLRETVDDVIILGPAPFWLPDLPTAVVSFWTTNKRFPERLQPAPKNYGEVDAILSAVAVEQGARFISVFDEICNEGGCLTHTPSSSSDLLSWDYGHLTIIRRAFHAASCATKLTGRRI